MHEEFAAHLQIIDPHIGDGNNLLRASSNWRFSIVFDPHIGDRNNLIARRILNASSGYSPIHRGRETVVEVCSLNSKICFSPTYRGQEFFNTSRGYTSFSPLFRGYKRWCWGCVWVFPKLVFVLCIRDGNEILVLIKISKSWFKIVIERLILDNSIIIIREYN